MTVAVAVSVLPRRMAGWAARRSLAPNALTGIGLACSLCAAAWFTAGTRPAALGGGLALAAGYLARRIGTQIVAAREAGGAAWDAAGAAADDRLMLAAFEGWLAGLCAAIGELASYAGLAVGAQASQRPGIWVLATEAAITLSLSQMVRLCQPAGPAPGQSPGQSSGQPPGTGRPSPWLWANHLLTLPAAARVAVIVLTAPLWGARITFLALVVSGAVGTVWVLARSFWTLSRRALASRGNGESGPPGGTRPVLGMIAACRDDGPVARLAGRIVQGQLAPLPPALAGLAGTVLLAALGLRNLPGILALAPVAAMLLAAVGASHRHDGPLDWLVPPVLQATQYIYLAALGFSVGVPGPVTFGLICLIALRQRDVAGRARLGSWPGQRAGLGWDGRILVVGLGVLLGVVTFAYLALAAYLGVLLCRVSLSGWLATTEGERR